MSHIIQELLFPGLELFSTEEMYVRLQGRVCVRLASRCLEFQVGGKVFLDTYFNAVSVSVWKQATTVDSLQLKLIGRGRFLIKVGLHPGMEQAHRWLMEQEVILPAGDPIRLPWDDLTGGLLYVALEALEPGEINSGFFLTEAAPAQEVRLGVVVTHFNRPAYVIPTIARLRRELIEAPSYPCNIDLFVVDNSKNLPPDQTDGATVIPNANYGGSGGFERGLLHLIDTGNYTHCLFMDDDASCEVESIRRAYMLHRFARSRKLGVSGALLREARPFQLHEAGGWFKDGKCRPRHHGLDMRHVHDLIQAGVADIPVVYGAWWFFAFKISEAEKHAFPFFVRGDDILFSIANNFEIITINSVACWGEDFSIKENPLTRYLGLRSTLALILMTSDAGRLRIFRLVLDWLIHSLLSHNYGSAEAIVEAILDVSRGPKFWCENLDAAAIREKIKPLADSEKLYPMNIAKFDIEYRGIYESRTRRMFRLFTLNGFLLPNFLIKNKTTLNAKSSRGVFRSIFGYRHVIYYSEINKSGYVVHYDRKKFF